VEVNSSFDETYELLFPLIYRFVSIRIPIADVEDVTAEIIVKVWRGLPNMEKLSALKPWALKIAAHQIADYYRSHKRTPVRALEDTPLPSPQTDQSEFLGNPLKCQRNPS